MPKYNNRVQKKTPDTRLITLKNKSYDCKKTGIGKRFSRFDGGWSCRESEFV